MKIISEITEVLPQRVLTLDSMTKRLPHNVRAFVSPEFAQNAKHETNSPCTQQDTIGTGASEANQYSLAARTTWKANDMKAD
jgi:hypothetical protein